jgi:hypothetical protein
MDCVMALVPYLYLSHTFTYVLIVLLSTYVFYTTLRYYTLTTLNPLASLNTPTSQIQSLKIASNSSVIV